MDNDAFWSVFRLVLFVILSYALCAGVTVDGRHYGIAGCTSSDGVKVEWGVQR
jgi:hypothetical protein